MQETFPAARYEPVGAACEVEVVNAIKRGDDIVIAEWLGHGPTLERLLRHLASYPRWARATRPGMDASEAVLETCRTQGFDASSFRSCGVETFHCLAATVEGLARRAPGCAIEVVAEATVDKVIGWGMFPEVPNTMLVSQKPNTAPQSLAPGRTTIPRYR
jgi:hypothetical protein